MSECFHLIATIRAAIATIAQAITAIDNYVCMFAFNRYDYRDRRDRTFSISAIADRTFSSLSSF